MIFDQRPALHPSPLGFILSYASGRLLKGPKQGRGSPFAPHLTPHRAAYGLFVQRWASTTATLREACSPSVAFFRQKEHLAFARNFAENITVPPFSAIEGRTKQLDKGLPPSERLWRSSLTCDRSFMGSPPLAIQLPFLIRPAYTYDPSERWSEITFCSLVLASSPRSLFVAH